MYKRNAAMGQQVSTASAQKKLDCDSHVVESENVTPLESLDETPSVDTTEQEAVKNQQVEKQTDFKEFEKEITDNNNSPSISDDQKLQKHPYEDSSSTHMIRFDDGNLVFNYAQLHDKPWKRSVDKFVRSYILNDKPMDKEASNPSLKSKATLKEMIADDSAIEKSTTNAPELNPQNKAALETLEESDLVHVQQQLQDSLSLQSARTKLRDCLYVQQYIQRQRQRLFGSANRFPYEATSIALVFSFLDAWTLLQVTQVNRLWRDTAYEDVCHCWEHLLRTDFHVSSESIRLNVQRRRQLQEEEELRTEKQRQKEEKARLKEEKRRKREAALWQKQRLDADKVEMHSSAGTAAVPSVEVETDINNNNININVNNNSQQENTNEPSLNPDSESRVLQCREQKVYEVVTLSSPAGVAADMGVSEIAAGEATADNTTSAPPVSPQPRTSQDVPLPPSYYSNARSRWAKEMYRDMHLSYHNLTRNQHALSHQPPVVPLQWLLESGSSLF